MELDGEWLEYFHAARKAAGYDDRGWQGRLARDIGVSDSQVTKWIQRQAKPTMENAARLAEAWRLNVLEVWVGMGYVSAEAVGLAGTTTPKPAQRQLPPELQRLANMLDRLTPEARANIEAMIAAAANLGELSSSTERPTGRSA